ncbi:Phosphatidylinositol transfer protein beta isoform [Microtus ochrogaster]|uniref:Phosphatidylinositol transfer protein beta isoform n=1 Tax=Microtus ochrogaster TaxID=79684 RepID=A0A8J6GDP5_MICOH|nr:Phosphatidylinositol transfer protein beta isoform [Microtus ochrogaster]
MARMLPSVETIQTIATVREQERLWDAGRPLRLIAVTLITTLQKGTDDLANEYMKDDFFIKIETWHKPDLGTLENVHGLDPNTWKTVEIVHIDIADRSQVEPADYKADEDPALFHSVKTKRGPLGPNWKKELANTPDCPKMCAYKLVTIKFKWWGLQSKVENFIQKQEKRIFTNLHRQLFCWIDKWIDLTMEDIRRMEDETQKELETVRLVVVVVSLINLCVLSKCRPGVGQSYCKPFLITRIFIQMEPFGHS